MTLGERIKELRIRKQLTQDDLAVALGTTKQTIHKYETSLITNIPLDKVATIANFLGTTPAFLMGWSHDDPASSDKKRSFHNDKDDITFDDFTYAMHNESKELTESEKEMLLDMARVLKAKHRERDRNGQASKPL